MKLYFSNTSPFVRKVLVLAQEVGLADRMELVTAVTAPRVVSEEVSAHNPLGKIPTLLLDDGSALYDSRVICEYLDSLHAGPKRMGSGARRFRILRTQALADGIVDAALLVRYEQFRAAGEQSPTWMQSQANKALLGLEQLQRELPEFGEEFDLGQISCCCALSWLRFRNPLAGCGAEPDQERRFAQLFEYLERMLDRPALRDSEPS